MGIDAPQASRSDAPTPQGAPALRTSKGERGRVGNSRNEKGYLGRTDSGRNKWEGVGPLQRTAASRGALQ